MINAALSAPGPWRRTLLTVVSRAAERFIQVAQRVAPADRAVNATPRWTGRDVIAHLAAEALRTNQVVRGDGEFAADRAAAVLMNEAGIGALAHFGVAELIDTIEDGVADAVAFIEEADGAQPIVMFDGGFPVRADLTLAVLVGELLVHGHDLAAEVGMPWPLSPVEAGVVLDGNLAVMNGWTSAAVDQRRRTFEVRVRRGPAIRFDVEDGHVRPAAQDTRPDAVLSGTPTAIVMTSYGRTSPVRAAISGQLTVSGRRPWAALSLARMFDDP